MSSPKAAAKTARRSASSARPKVKGPSVKVLAPKAKAPQTGLSAEAIRLAGEIERSFAKSDNVLSEEAIQTLMAALCRVYTAQMETGANYTPIPVGQVVNPTGVMVTASGLLRAANLAVFELGMWQNWTGR